MWGEDQVLWKPWISHILIVDWGNACIEKFSMEGKFVSAVGSRGIGKLHFDRPENIIVHPSRKVLLADMGNRRIQALNHDHSFSHSLGSRGSKHDSPDLLTTWLLTVITTYLSLTVLASRFCGLPTIDSKMYQL